ncbi:DUF1835 domain-containing protein [Paraflavitalea pollutisoli]|uniref:DUF1835 domain-containing protein n=1 Tax=Paraflavitalea pollutisoli TaxID=3034143 RepID=UPI0023ED856E|nr:DUF1835 domain-containing protein [Paraflavitalea sp. H1-2-19X]
MIHIVFNEADVDVLKKAIELDPSLEGEVWQVKDDYAVGPLVGIYTVEGIEARKQWWRDVLAGGDFENKIDDGSVDDNKLVADLIEKLKNDPAEIVYIWAAQNKHDVSGYYWLMSQLKDFQGRLFILYLNNLPFINEKGLIFYPEWLHVIPPKEFLKAKKLARQITLSEFEVDPDEWAKLQQEDKGVRLLEGGKKLGQHGYDYYDEDLKKYITNDWQKGSKIISQFLSKNKQTTGDAYMLWRLKSMIAAGGYDVQGYVKFMKEFEVKNKAAQLAETTSNP